MIKHDGHLRTRGKCRQCSVLESKQERRSFFSVLFIPYNKSFIDQASSVKIMAGYWPRSLFTFLWTSTSSRSTKTQKENSANIQSSLRWPTSATAKLTFPRQNLLFHGKTYFSTAKLTFSRQNLLFHGKTYFSIPSFQSVSAYNLKCV